MSFTVIYRKLLEVNIYHNYFLDDGTTEFDTSVALKTEQLDKYDISTFLKITPSKSTQELFDGHKIVFKKTLTGFILFIKADETAPTVFSPYLGLDQSENFTFLIYITDPFFENYSIVSPIQEIPFFFSNKKPFTEGSGFQYIDLESTSSPITDFEISESTYNTFKASISEKEKTQLFGVISLEIAGDDTTAFDGNTRNILSGSGEIISTPKTYKIQIKNRSTIWNYIDAVDNSLLHSTDPAELPIVKNGRVGHNFDSKEWPSAKPSRLIFEKDGGGIIIKTISEIYIN